MRPFDSCRDEKKERITISPRCTDEMTSSNANFATWSAFRNCVRFHGFRKATAFPHTWLQSRKYDEASPWIPVSETKEKCMEKVGGIAKVNDIFLEKPFLYKCSLQLFACLALKCNFFLHEIFAWEWLRLPPRVGLRATRGGMGVVSRGSAGRIFRLAGRVLVG